MATGTNAFMKPLKGHPVIGRARTDPWRFLHRPTIAALAPGSIKPAATRDQFIKATVTASAAW